MSKFKIGDKVRFIGDIKKHEQYDNDDNYIGDFVKQHDSFTIGNFKRLYYELKENPFWSFNENELELVKTRYKVGDKVKVKEDLVANKLYGKDTFAIQMVKYKGMITQIEKIFDDKEYWLRDCEDWWFTDEMLEPVFNNTVLDNSVKEFTIDDLINAPLGTKITIDNKKEFVKIDNENFENKEYCLTIGESIMKDLTLGTTYPFMGVKITKVEIPEYKTVYVDNTKKKMTLKDIEEKLGYEIELVEE